MYIIKHGNNLNESLSEDDSVWRDELGNVYNKKRLIGVLNEAMKNIARNHIAVYNVMKHVNVEYVSSPLVRTMATDGDSIFVSPKFVHKLCERYKGEAIKVVEFVLVHEAFHIIMNHCYEHATSFMQFPDPTVVNMAQDYQINYIIEKFLVGPDGSRDYEGCTNKANGLYDEKYKGKVWQKLYDEVAKEKPLSSAGVKEKTSAEWKNGFADGYADVLNELRKQKVIEQCQI